MGWDGMGGRTYVDYLPTFTAYLHILSAILTCACTALDAPPAQIQKRACGRPHDPVDVFAGQEQVEEFWKSEVRDDAGEKWVDCKHIEELVEIPERREKMRRGGRHLFPAA